MAQRHTSMHMDDPNIHENIKLNNTILEVLNVAIVWKVEKSILCRPLLLVYVPV